MCIVILDETHPVIHSSYIGDSGYIILRLEYIHVIINKFNRKSEKNLDIVFKSEEHCRSFNFPYQVENLEVNIFKFYIDWYWW